MARIRGIAVHGHPFVGFLAGWRGGFEGRIINIPRTLIRG